jgi:hypothetical protein
MNRHERRAAKKRNLWTTIISIGRLREHDPNYGLPLICYACGTPHKALGVALIEHQSGITDVPLCEPCFADNNICDVIQRKFWNAPKLEIEDGGDVTTEQFQALIEKQDKLEH